jgi:hypothetical protein
MFVIADQFRGKSASFNQAAHWTDIRESLASSRQLFCNALFSIYHKLPFYFAMMKLITTWAHLLPSVFGSTCYFSDGAEDTSAQIAPCPSLYNTKMRCWLNNLTDPDACTTQGLCLSNSSNVPFWVDACTDINWGSGCSPLGKICCSLLYHLTLPRKTNLKLIFGHSQEH